jgi:hypothetical protein
MLQEVFLANVSRDMGTLYSNVHTGVLRINDVELILISAYSFNLKWVIAFFLNKNVAQYLKCVNCAAVINCKIIIAFISLAHIHKHDFKC